MSIIPARLLLLLLPLALVGACVSTPQASRERDAQAKQFNTHPATAAVYIFRPDWQSNEEDSVLYIGTRLIGATLPGGYFRVDLRPGRHLLHGFARDAGLVEIDVRAGEIQFVSLKVLGGQSFFSLRPEAAGRDELLACCELLENWAPGQRPLLR